MSDTQLAERPQSVKDFLALPAYKSRFGEVLGQRAPQFMASLIQLTNDPYLGRCEPKSVIASAMIAAVLDFPIEKSLGFAHIVPYGGVAQFQMAAKGYVQLALRSGQYQRLNAKPVNAEAFEGYDEVGEPRINWEMLDETKPIIGYVVAWRLTNGFTKIAYWPKAKVEAHAAQFSQAYKKKKMDSPWFTNFDKMALKTVVMNELRAWGVLSVQMQTAMKHDMGAQKDVDAEVEYIDADATVVADSAQQAEAPARPAPPKRSPKGAAAVQENAKPTEKPIEAEIVPAKDATSDPAIALAAAERIVANDRAKEAQRKALETKLAQEAKANIAAEDPAPKAPEPRTSLSDGEVLETTCKVDSVQSLMVKSGGELKASVMAEVSGGFTGSVMHIGGGEVPGGEKDPVPLPVWRGNVHLTLRGRLNKASGRMLVMVDKIVEAQSATPTVSVE